MYCTCCQLCAMLVCGLMAVGVLGQQSSDHASWRGMLVGSMVSLANLHLHTSFW
jgi:hypothetical protein